MASQERIRQARATNENLIWVMRRKPGRNQVMKPEPMAKRLKKIAITETVFTRYRYLFHACVGGARSSPVEARKPKMPPRRPSQSQAAMRVLRGSHSVPGWAAGIGRFLKSSLRPTR